jgi:nucleoid DNA-binding protein
MDKEQFIKYVEERYGFEEGVAETMVTVFADSLQDVILAGYSVNIDEIGEFQTTPLFPKGFDHKNNAALAKVAQQNRVIFKPSEKLIQGVA